jgi:hypothetical protein
MIPIRNSLGLARHSLIRAVFYCLDSLPRLIGTRQQGKFYSKKLMSQSVQFEVEVPDDLARFRLPGGVQHRLQELLDKQDGGLELTGDEQREAEGLVDMADFLALLRLRAERSNGGAAPA